MEDRAYNGIKEGLRYVLCLQNCRTMAGQVLTEQNPYFAYPVSAKIVRFEFQ